MAPPFPSSASRHCHPRARSFCHKKRRAKIQFHARLRGRCNLPAEFELRAKKLRNMRERERERCRNIRSLSHSRASIYHPRTHSGKKAGEGGSIPYKCSLSATGHEWNPFLLPSLPPSHLPPRLRCYNVPGAIPAWEREGIRKKSRRERKRDLELSSRVCYVLCCSWGNFENGGGGSNPRAIFTRSIIPLIARYLIPLCWNGCHFINGKNARFEIARFL